MPYPEAVPRKRVNVGGRKMYTRVLTDMPEKAAIEAALTAQSAKNLGMKRKSAKQPSAQAKK